MESAKFAIGSVATLAFGIVVVLCVASMSVSWHNASEIARLQSRVERLEAEDKSNTISQLLGQLGVQTSVYQEDGIEEEIPGHQGAREARQVDIDALVAQIVQRQLEAHLNCSTDEETKCTIEPGPKGDPGPPGPQGETGAQGWKGDRGEEGEQGYPGFKGQEGTRGEVGEQGLQGLRGERGQKGDMGTRGPEGQKGESGDTGPRGLSGAKGGKGQLGYTGYKGQKGEVGDQGTVGPVGGKGDTGDRGPQGPSGGEKGERGDAGREGQTGAKGQKGQLGYPGYKGNKGEIGVQGEKGSAGDTGLMGARGEKGDQGTTGEPREKAATPADSMGEEGENGGTGSYSCGDTSGWARVAYLNMTNSSHQCPGNMEEVTFSGKRLCGRGYCAFESCMSANFSTHSLQYSQVCGRITGYQYGYVYAFNSYSHLPEAQSIDSWYVDGVSVTHGPPGSREHVWTFASGYNEDGPYSAVCPCAPNAHSSIVVPPFVGQDYFCESAVSTGTPAYRLYSEDPLWDGDRCTVAGNTCCEFNTPPYFTKCLTNPTNNDLEVRACGYRSRSSSLYSADTLIELIELYIK